MAQGLRPRTLEARRDRHRRTRRDQPARHLRRRRCDDRALQADRGRDGSGREGGPDRVRLPHPHRTGGRDRAGGLTPPSLMPTQAASPLRAGGAAFRYATANDT